MQGGHLWPRKRLRLKSLEAAGYHRWIITPWPALTLFHQHVTGDKGGLLLLGVREVLTDL